MRALCFGAPMPRKYPMPDFLVGRTTEDAYESWLNRKALSHSRRDRKRGHEPALASRELYKAAIHQAVLAGQGRDAYTGEELEWSHIGRYDNEESKKGRHAYKRGFALLPTVDHEVASATQATFRICAWRTNDAKHDLTPDEFVELCRRVVAFVDGKDT